MSDLAIDLRNVSKSYRGRVHALQGIDLRVNRGEVFGLLGPNGAGKSTLIKIIMTVIRPTTAEGTILSAPVGTKSVLSRVGYLPENHRFPRYLTGRQTLDFFAALLKVARLTRRRRADQLLDIVGMRDWADRKIATYSKGMMQRIGLAQAMMNDPDLILLDEPTDGVDPVGRRDIRDVLAQLRAMGKTVFVNSHLLSELEMICDRVAILVGGKVAAQGTLEELALSKQWYEIELTPSSDVAASEILLHAALNDVVTWDQPPTAAGLSRRGTFIASGQWAEQRGLVVKVGTTDPADVQPVLDLLRARQLIIRRVQAFRPTLEELFISAVERHPERGRHRADAKLK